VLARVFETQLSITWFKNRKPKVIITVESHRRKGKRKNQKIPGWLCYENPTTLQPHAVGSSGGKNSNKRFGGVGGLCTPRTCPQGPMPDFLSGVFYTAKEKALIKGGKQERRKETVSHKTAVWEETNLKGAEDHTKRRLKKEQLKKAGGGGSTGGVGGVSQHVQHR